MLSVCFIVCLFVLKKSYFLVIARLWFDSCFFHYSSNGMGKVIWKYKRPALQSRIWPYSGNFRVNPGLSVEKADHCLPGYAMVINTADLYWRRFC